MNLNEEQLKEVETMAGLFFSPEKIGIALELDLHEVEEFREIIDSNPLHPIYKAYHRGDLTTQVELRTAIKQSALNGSNPAQSAMLNFKQD